MRSFGLPLHSSAELHLSSGVEEVVLDNGLQLLLKPVPTSNAVSSWIFYRVGSRNESPGITGASHWCEHMMFKGAGKLGKGEVHTLVSNEGGRNNAFTDQDLTAYYETLPKNKLELALHIESERMQGAAFDPSEVESERHVIISEREGSENYPTYLLREEVYSTAYRIHHYRWPVVGWKSDLMSMSRDDLYSYYRAHYHPNNAILVLCGNFQNSETIKLVKQYFSRLEAGHDITSKPKSDQRGRNLSISEPEQRGERMSKLTLPGKLDYLAAGYHLPRTVHEDTPSLIVLSTILGGWTGLIGLSGNRFEPRSNRLYRKLVEGKLASEVNTYFPVNIDPGLLYFEVTILPGIGVEAPRVTLLSTLDEIKDAPPSEKEMLIARNQIKSWHAYENDGISLQAQSLGIMELLGRRSLADELVQECMTTSPEQVQRAAKKYLGEENRTLCIYESKDSQPTMN